MDEVERERAERRVGTTINGAFRLDAVLGLGGMATVYAATQEDGARVALKILHAELAGQRSIEERFLREGYVANRIDHRGRVEILGDDVTEEGEPFLIMELLEGQTIEALCQRRGPTLPLVIGLSITEQVLDTLGHFHDHGVIHRDLKPGNIFITKGGVVKLLDFGVARVREPKGENDADQPDKTRPGTALGTPAYMAPEQAMGFSEGVDARVDLFSLGATLYTMLTGHLIHEGRSESESFVLAATVAAPSIREVAPDMDERVIALVDKALAWDPDNRFATADEMREEVARVLGALRAESAAAKSAEAAEEDESPYQDDPPSREIAPAAPPAPKPSSPEPASSDPALTPSAVRDVADAAGTALPGPTAAGKLSGTPLAHLLVYMLDRELTGTTVLQSPDGPTFAIYFERGLPAKIRAGSLRVPLDRILTELSVLDEATLRETLAESSEKKKLHGEVLVARGLLDRPTLLAVLSVQVGKKLAQLFDLPSDTRFAYYDGKNLLAKYGGPEATPCEVLSALMAGLRRTVEESAIESTIARFAGAKLRLNPEGDLRRFALRSDEQAVAALIREGGKTIDELIEAGVASVHVVRLTVYALAITRFVDAGVAGRPPVGGAIDLPPIARMTRTSREIAAPVPPPPPSIQELTPGPDSGPPISRRAAELRGTVAASERKPAPFAAVIRPARSAEARPAAPAQTLPSARPPSGPEPRAASRPEPRPSSRPPARPSSQPQPQPRPSSRPQPRPSTRPQARPAAPSTPPAEPSSRKSQPQPIASPAPPTARSAPARPPAAPPTKPSPAPPYSPKAAPAHSRPPPAAETKRVLQPPPPNVDRVSRPGPPPAPRREPPRAAPAAAAKPTVDVAARRAMIEQRLKTAHEEDFFKLLGVDAKATKEQVQQAYFAAAKIWHPDRLPAELSDLKAEVSRAFSRFNEAFQTLSDPTRKSEYEKKLAAGVADDDAVKVAAVMDAVVDFQKAEVFMKVHDFDAAEAHVKRAVQSDPAQPEYLTLLAWVQSLKRGDPPALDPGEKSSHYDDLIRVLDQVLTKEPRYERALFYRGTLLKRSGRVERALADFRLAAQINPRNVDATREVRLYEMRKRTAAKAKAAPEPPSSGLFGKFFKK